MKIICIGHNYREHIKELGHRIPDDPVFFMKPDTALLRNNDPFYIPRFSHDLHYELELVVRIGRVAKHVEEKFAPRCYDEVGLGVDFTARDIQRLCIEKGLPWEAAKAFDHSAAVSPVFVNKEEAGEVGSLKFRLEKNGETVQNGDTSDMIFGVDRIIAYVSQFVTLKIGDLIFTGTPAGVGPVHPGDVLRGWLGDRLLLDFEVR